MNPSTAQPAGIERSVVGLLCLLAGLHVFIFSAAFPFFNVVDEQAHFDLVVRYSQGDVPRSIAPPCAEALPFLAVFDNLEYLWPPESQPDGRIPPPTWKLPARLAREVLHSKENFYLTKMNNVENANSPLYYSLAGAWWRLGKGLGLDGGQLLYWLRFLNVPLLMALVGLSWLTARQVFPANRFIRLAVPAFIALLPQASFYAINNDVLAPLAGGVAFWLLLQWWEAEMPAPRLAAATGLALALAFLAKISSLPLLMVAGIFLALRFCSLARQGKSRAALPSYLVLVACAALPMAAWICWCKTNFGDYTGTAQKTVLLGWTHKPFSEWFHHPLFTPGGCWTFVSGNLATLWQGEVLWHGRTLALPVMDGFYVLATLILLAVALLALLRPSGLFPPAPRAALWLAFGFLAATFGFYALLSVQFDFHNCFYPSRARPFFTSGRLMLGLLIPFLLLLASGLDRVLQPVGLAAKFLLLAAWLLFMLTMEVVTDWAVFQSDYNWFHL